MKPKWMMWLLGAAAVMVWGLIIYRVWQVAAGDMPVPSGAQSGVYKLPEERYAETDTFTLALNYRDPFEAWSPAPSEQVHPMPGQPAARKTVMPQPVLATPEIVDYKGYIINPASKKIVSVMTIKNKERMMTEGELFDEVRLLKNMKDSVKVACKGIVKVIRLHK
jgi:hypothetical protein